jgi:hypothetical protein
MTDSITPPPELVQQWHEEWCNTDKSEIYDEWLATCAAQWAADQELEACLANIHTMYGKDKADWLRAMRRPKPPNLKEQALALLQPGEPRLFNSEMQDTLRRALEALPE